MARSSIAEVKVEVGDVVRRKVEAGSVERRKIEVGGEGSSIKRKEAINPGAVPPMQVRTLEMVLVATASTNTSPMDHSSNHRKRSS